MFNTPSRSLRVGETAQCISTYVNISIFTRIFQSSLQLRESCALIRVDLLFSLHKEEAATNQAAPREQDLTCQDGRPNNPSSTESGPGTFSCTITLQAQYLA
jgi:hypothetical protein